MSTLRGERAKDRKRSRIVVNVEDAPRAGKRRGGDPDRTVREPIRRRMSRRGRRRAAIIVAVVALILLGAVAGVYGWYQGYKKSPAYSLALLVDAARKGDRQTVDALLDIDQVTHSLVPQVIDKVSARGQGTGQQQGGQQPVPASVRRYIEANAGVLIPGARDAVRAALVAGVRNGVASRADGQPFFLTALGARFAADEIREEGDVGTVAFKSNNQPVTLTLQRAGGGERWRIVGVESGELAARIADNLARGLPALGR